MRLALALMWLSLPTIGYAGGRAGNGFALECRDDQEHGLKAGYYSLDYLVTMGLGPSVKVKSWKESAARIRKRLVGVLSAKQLALYDDFVATVRNTEDYSKTRVWEASKFGVLNLKTEASPDQPGQDPLHMEQLKSNLKSLVQKVPDACLDSKGEIGLIPAVVFQDSFFTGRPEGYLVYKFVPKVLESLDVNDALQLSYLYIHEWLWDISNNEDRNRRINHLLHSEKADAVSTGELRKQLKGMGLDVTSADESGKTEPNAEHPDLESGDLEESYRKTAVPDRKFGVMEIQKQLMKGQVEIQMGPYQVHALSRSCPQGRDCTPWKKAEVIWNDLGRKHAVPESGEVFLQRDANLTLTVKSNPVNVDGEGDGRIVSTECKLDPSDKGKNNGTCRKMWGPEADFKPIGHLWVDETSPDLTTTFTKSHLWIGAHTKRGELESRIAFIVPYAAGVTLKEEGAEDGAWLHVPREDGVPRPGQSTLFNGQDEYVWEIPMNSVGNEGRFGSRQLVKHTLYAFTQPGTLRALRAYVVYDGDLESAGVTVKRMTKGAVDGNYGMHSDLNVLPLRTPVPSFPEFAKAAELRPGFAVKDARGDYEIEFDLRPAANSWARVHSLRFLLRKDKT